MQAEEAYQKFEQAQLEVLSAIEREYQQLIQAFDSVPLQRLGTLHQLFIKMESIPMKPEAVIEKKKNVEKLEKQFQTRAEAMSKIWAPFGFGFGQTPTMPSTSFGGQTQSLFSLPSQAPTATGISFGQETPYGIPRKVPSPFGLPRQAPFGSGRTEESPPQKKSKL